jgi:hypothetical protein
MLDTHYKYDKVENMVDLLDVIDKESYASFLMDDIIGLLSSFVQLTTQKTF